MTADITQPPSSAQFAHLLAALPTEVARAVTISVAEETVTSAVLSAQVELGLDGTTQLLRCAVLTERRVIVVEACHGGRDRFEIVVKTLSQPLGDIAAMWDSRGRLHLTLDTPASLLGEVQPLNCEGDCPPGTHGWGVEIMPRRMDLIDNDARILWGHAETFYSAVMAATTEPSQTPVAPRVDTWAQQLALAVTAGHTDTSRLHASDNEDEGQRDQ